MPGVLETFSLGFEHHHTMADESVTERIRRLASGKCVPCNDAKPFRVEEASERLKDLPGWVLLSGSIQKEFRFKSYLAGLDFAYSLGKIAELENHHPDLFIGWHRVKVVLSTHAIKGLSQNDFVMAAKSEIEFTKQNGRDAS
jgi:4a-hydroxytetrahydrobiopterin dehydratase